MRLPSRTLRRPLSLALVGVAALIGCGDTSDIDVFGGTPTTGAGGSSSSATTTSSDATTTSTSSGGGEGGGTGGAAPSCGDGTKDASEECDGADLGGSSCLDAGFSSAEGMVCANCDLDASGCKATCDGQLREPGEACDGADLGGASCLDAGYSSPDGAACQGCALDYTGCQATCDGQLLEPGETCDGGDLGGASCLDAGYSSPDGASCNGCSDVDYSGCQTTCDGQLLEPGEACDGANLGGASCLDVGFANAAGATCVGCAVSYAGCMPSCGNGALEPTESCDDGNMMSGDGCSSACAFEGLTCASAIPVALAAGSTTLTGDTTGGGAHGEAACASAGPDRVYAVTPAANGYLTASLSRAATAYGSVLYAATSCNDAAAVSAVLCADSVDPMGVQSLLGGEVLSFPVQANGTYYVYVDGANAAAAGAYSLVLDLSTGVGCNDPVPLPLEPGSPMRVLGSTTGLQPLSSGTCGGNPGGEVVYSLTRGGPGPLTVATDPAITNYNSVLHARTNCSSQNSEVACSNNQGNAVETVNLTFVQGTTLTLRVDGSTSGGGNSSGNYGLVLTP